MNRLSIVEEVEKLPAVYLVEGKVEFEVRVHVQQLDDVVGCEQVQAGDLPVTGSHHRECLPTASLPVGEASSLRAFECFRDERQDAFLVDSLVVSIVVVSIVKGEQVLLNILRQINFHPKRSKFHKLNIEKFKERIYEENRSERAGPQIGPQERVHRSFRN